MKKYIFIILSFVVLQLACKKGVLDKVPLDIISDATIWKDKALIDAYLTQCYSEIYIFTNEAYGNTSTTGESYPTWGVVNGMSDECKMQWAINVSSFKNGGLKISGGLLEWWEDSYSVIRKLNEFIQKIPETAIDDNLKKSYLAQARFLRAYNYFSMVKRYGGVPLITVPQGINDPKDSLYPKRAREQEVYDFVIAEMESIANDLPLQNLSSDYGRPNKYAALALQSRAALYAGSIAANGTVQLDGVLGIPASLSESYYRKSFEASKSVIKSGKFALYDKNPDKAMNFRQIFLEKNNAEAIFVKQHTFTNKDAGGNGWSYDFFQCPKPQAWGGGNTNGVYLELAEEFEHIDGSTGKLDRTALQTGLWTIDELWANKDPRFFGTLYTQNTPWKGTLLDWHNGLVLPGGTIQTTGSYNGVLALGTQRTFDGTGFGVLKYLDESKDNFGERATSGTDWIVFRYAEMLLNYAEAGFEIGEKDEALWAVNEIRKRAGIAVLQTLDRNKIRHERKVELAFEGHRYWDVRRWRTAVADLSVNNSGLRYILDYTTRKYKLEVVSKIDGTVGGPAFYSHQYYFPVTLARTSNNSNLVENPGY